MFDRTPRLAHLFALALPLTLPAGLAAQEALEFTPEEAGLDEGLEFTPEEAGLTAELDFDPGPVEGALFDGCDIAPSDFVTVVQAALVGSWNAQQNGGAASVPGVGTVRVPPQGQVETFTFSGEPGALTLSSALFQALPVTVVTAAELEGYEYGFAQSDGSVVVMDFTTDEPPNCDVALLPVVRAAGEIVGVDGNPGYAEAFLHFLDEDTLSGVWAVTGQAEGTQVHYRVFMSLWR